MSEEIDETLDTDSTTETTDTEVVSLLIIEDGSLPDDANAYFDVDFLKNYCRLHGKTEFEGKTDTEIEQCIIRNTQYVNSVFNWKGEKYDKKQSMAFPRENMRVDGIIVSGIPKELKYAICEACCLGVNGSLYQTESEKGAVASESIGGAISISYFQGTKKEMQTLYESINSLLRGFYYDYNKKSVVTSRIMR